MDVEMNYCKLWPSLARASAEAPEDTKALYMQFL